MATTTVYASKDASAIYKSGVIDGWSGHDNHHPVGFNGSSYKWRSFIYFPVSFTGMTAINSATLYVRGHRAAGVSHCYGDQTTDRTLYVNRVTSTWDEGTDRGENVWSTNETWDWSNRSGAYTTTGQASLLFPSGVTHGTWYSLSLTDIVRSWAPVSAGGSATANYGVILRNSSETDADAGLEFYAEDSGSGYKPYLVIDYSTNTAPNAPTNLTPDGTSGSPTLVSGLTPTFTGVFSDPDAGDTVSAVNIIVYQSTTEVSNFTTNTTNSSWSIPYTGAALSGNTTYNFKARCKDAAGSWGAFSSLYYFKPNSTPLAPSISLSESPTTDVLTLTPTFNVTHNDPDTSDNKAYAYTIEVQTEAGAAVASTGDVTLGVAISTVTLTYGAGALTGATALTPGSTYRWRARTKDANGAWSSFSGWSTFTIHITAVPTGLTPVEGATATVLNPTFSGARGSDNDTLTEVTIQIYNSTGTTQVGNDFVATSGVTSSGFSVTWPNSTDLTTGTTYKYRVKVKTTTYGYSAYSSLITFSVDTAGVNLVSPNGVTNASSAPSYQFSRSTSFRYYRIEVSLVSDGSIIWDSNNTDGSTSTTSKTIAHGGTALTYGGIQYRWRVKVSNVSAADLNNVSYSGYAYFSTDSAGSPSLTSPISGSWITTTTPTFQFSRSGSDVIALYQILLYKVVNDADVLVWDSGSIDLSPDANTVSKVYDGSTALEGGYTYRWKARYTKTTNLIQGQYSALESFYINASPSVPTNLSPAAGAAVNGTNPVFEATFVDPDQSTRGDYPTEWEILITNNNDTAFRTVTLTTSLNSGANTWTYTGSPSLVSGSTYKWQTRFKDSKAVAGTYSSVRTFKASTPPTGTITTPSEGSTVNNNRVTFGWTFDGASVAQSKYRLVVKRTLTAAGGGDDPSQDITVYDSGEVAQVVADGGSGSHTMPSGYTTSGYRYRAYLYVWDADGVPNTTADTQAFTVNVAAPPAMSSVSIAPEDYLSRVKVEWVPQESVVPTGFAGFRILRRQPGDDDFTAIANISDWTQRVYYDYYAPNNVQYEYIVRQVKYTADDPDLESPDSEIGAVSLSSEDWVVVGKDRDASHIFILPVVEEEHQRPVQQEVFEPVGSNRKVIARGSVLGHEGTLTCQWASDEATVAKQQVEYLYSSRGPHILKSPFGDAWEVEFAGPSSRYASLGHLTMTLSYIEVSERTSEIDT